MTYSPQPIFAPVPRGAHINGSIDCLIAAEADGDIDDCNKAASDLADELRLRFDALVEMTGDLPQFKGMTFTERDGFTYYAIMEAIGHGVGLTDDPGRFPSDAIDLARDKASDLNKAVRSLVAWMETHINTDWNDQTVTVAVEVEVYSRDSIENSEAAGRFTIPATAFEIGDWLSWIDGFDLDTNDEDAHDNTEEYTTLEVVQMLDACDMSFEGTSWTNSANLQELLAVHGYRRLPRVRLGGGDVEVISASLSVSVVKVVDPQGDDNLADPEGLECGRDSYYGRYKAATAAKEETDADPS